MLKVEKRHRKSCRYDEYDRTHKKCTCPYWAVGTLNGVFIRKSLKTSNYEVASRRTRDWELEGSLQDEGAVTVSEAIGAFIRDIAARNWQESTKRKFHTLLYDRLIKYAQQRGYHLLKELDLHSITEFRATWEDAPLTAQKNIERTRAFFRFCIDRQWVTVNPASKLKVKVTIEEKDPFTPDEFDRIMEATHLYQDGHGRVDQDNAKQLRAFVLALRYSGLRISDVVKLERSQLVPSADGDGWGLRVQQQKVRRTVYIPLPDGKLDQPDVVGSLQGLASQSDTYFFWSGTGDLQRAVGSWRTKLAKLFKIAQTRTGSRRPFARKPHPHRFRHTFAAEYLNSGVPIETVALLLGHASVKVTERYYAKFNRARQETIDDAVRAAWKSKRRRLHVLEGGSKKMA